MFHHLHFNSLLPCKIILSMVLHRLAKHSVLTAAPLPPDPLHYASHFQSGQQSMQSTPMSSKDSSMSDVYTTHPAAFLPVVGSPLQSPSIPKELQVHPMTPLHRLKIDRAFGPTEWGKHQRGEAEARSVSGPDGRDKIDRVERFMMVKSRIL